jgi:DNA-binding protein StpA
MPDYTEIKCILSNVRSINALVREMDYVFLLEAYKKLGAALAERKNTLDRRQKELMEKEEKKKELLSLIASEGFTLEELKASKKNKKTQAERPQKYQFTENGEMKFWTGIGRPPKPIASAVETGKSIDDFLITAHGNENIAPD